MASGSINRSDARHVSMTFRLSVAQREEIRRRAAAQGMTLTDYTLTSLLGTEVEPLRTGRPRNDERDTEMFPMTG